MALINPHARRAPPFWRGGAFEVLLMLLTLAVGAGASELSAAPPEFQVKAVFLSNFARFVEWPAGIAAEQGAVVIGVLGADPFGEYLDEVLRDQQVSGRPLVVKRYRRVSEIERCHVLFISGSEGANVEAIRRGLENRPILTVCDTTLFARHGTMIHLVMDEHRVRLRINLEAAKQVGLVISSKLLRTAEIVSDHDEEP